MIPRYTRKEMADIWSDQNKFSIWLEIEILACEALAELGEVPAEAVKEIRKQATFNVDRILDIEETTKHDIIAFLTNVEESIGENSRFMHLGMTSSDVLDTCFAVQCKQSGMILLNGLNRLKVILQRRAQEFKYTVCIGRSHGIHAEPTTFGLKFALWFEECKRNIKRLEQTIENVAQGKISGAVGTYEHISPKVEEYVCLKLGIAPASISTQVVQRDIHAEFISTLAIIASLLEKIALEIRHLQRTEVGEAEEYFSPGQKGSSAMPHKRNPISSENICGQARLIRSNFIAAIENNALWHERDISHSSVERVIFPDSTVTLDYILNRTCNLVEKLVAYPEKMQKNLDLTHGLIYSQKILIALARKGLKRQDAYVLVQKSAMRTFESAIPFFQTLTENEDLMKHFTKDELLLLFSYDEIFKSVDIIFKRCEID
jgi:adenylosuccinate lyase